MARKIAAAMSSSRPACLRWPKPRVRRDETRMPRPITANKTPIRNLVWSTMCILNPLFQPAASSRNVTCQLLLAGQAFIIVSALQLDLAKVGRVVRLDSAGEAGALDRLGAQIIEAFDAELPGAIMEHQQVPFVDVGRDEQVQRLGLIDIGRAVGRQLEQPALVDLEAGLEHVLFLGREEIEMLDGAAALEDRRPDAVAILR